MFRFCGAALVMTSVLAACSDERIVSSPGVGGTYTTTPFAITPRHILIVDDMVTDSGDLVLYADPGACTHPADNMEPVRVRHAPRGAFHVGQLIAFRELLTWPSIKVEIRTVTRQEAQRVGCSAIT
jgi:hypothetical protein